MATLAVTGRIAPRSQPARMTVRGEAVTPTRTPMLALPKLTPLGRDVQALCDAILRGDVEPCPVCGRLDCDLDDWHEVMNADPHGDLSWRDDVELPF